MVSSGQSSAMWSGLVTAHSHQAQHLQQQDPEATEPLLGIFTEPQCRELETTRTTSFFPKDIVVQSRSRVWLFATLWTTARQDSLSFTISRVCSNSCPLSQWHHPTISFSVVPVSSSSFVMAHLAGWASQVVLVVKKIPASAGDTRDTGSVFGWGRSPEGRHGNPLQYSRLEESCGQRSLVGYCPCGLPGVLGFFSAKFEISGKWFSLLGP